MPEHTIGTREEWQAARAELAKLEAEAAALPPSPGAELRARLRGDCHAHTEWSDGKSSIETMAEAARELGHAHLRLFLQQPADRAAALFQTHRFLASDHVRSQKRKQTKVICSCEKPQIASPSKTR
jgi:hypothetical protein